MPAYAPTCTCTRQSYVRHSSKPTLGCHTRLHVSSTCGLLQICRRKVATLTSPVVDPSEKGHLPHVLNPDGAWGTCVRIASLSSQSKFGERPCGQSRPSERTSNRKATKHTVVKIFQQGRDCGKKADINITLVKNATYDNLYADLQKESL